MLTTIIILLALILGIAAGVGSALLLQGASFMAIAQDIQASQAAMATALATIAAQQSSQISAADAAAILANENANLAAAQALIIP